jgi:hypothetical protein
MTVKEAMLIPSFENTYTLLETYVGKRPRRGPFPLESAFTWSLLLNAQTCNRVRGGMLEIGVEFGTSAFLLLEALAADEHATLIDLVKTEEWLAGINGPYSNHTAYTPSGSAATSGESLVSGQFGAYPRAVFWSSIMLR